MQLKLTAAKRRGIRRVLHHSSRRSQGRKSLIGPSIGPRTTPRAHVIALLKHDLIPLGELERTMHLGLFRKYMKKAGTLKSFKTIDKLLSGVLGVPPNDARRNVALERERENDQSDNSSRFSIYLRIVSEGIQACVISNSRYVHLHTLLRKTHAQKRSLPHDVPLSLTFRCLYFYTPSDAFVWRLETACIDEL